LQHVAVERHLRVSFLSGDVHLTTASNVSSARSRANRQTNPASLQFHSIIKTPPAQDPKFMVQIVSSAIVNTPPPQAVVLMVNKVGAHTHRVRVSDLLLLIFSALDVRFTDSALCRYGRDDDPTL
jgi:hypothetical protein